MMDECEDDGEGAILRVIEKKGAGLGEGTTSEFYPLIWPDVDEEPNILWKPIYMCRSMKPNSMTLIRTLNSNEIKAIKQIYEKNHENTVTMPIDKSVARKAEKRDAKREIEKLKDNEAKLKRQPKANFGAHQGY